MLLLVLGQVLRFFPFQTPLPPPLPELSSSGVRMTPRPAIMATVMVAALLCLLSCLNFEALASAAAESSAGRQGTRFITGFLDAHNSTGTPGLLIVLQKPEVGDVNVSVRMPAYPAFEVVRKTISWTNHSGAEYYIELPQIVRMASSGTNTNSGILVETSTEVILYALNRLAGNNSSQDAFIVLPDTSLGTEYYVTSYHPVGDRKYVRQIGIVGVSNDTNVNVKIPLTLNESIIYRWNGHRYRSEEDNINITLNAYGTLYIESIADLTGVHVLSSLPVVVLSGDVANSNDSTSLDVDKANVPGQIVPHTEHWGRTFISMPFSGTTHYRVVVRENYTSIHIKQKSSKKHQVTLSPPDHKDVHISHPDDFVNIQTTKPVIVLQFITAQLVPVMNDHMVLLLPPVNTQSHQTAASSTYTFGATYRQPHQVNLVISAPALSPAQREQLMLDGEPLTGAAKPHTNNSNRSKLVHIEGLDNQNFTAVQLTVGGGSHNLSHSNMNSNAVAEPQHAVSFSAMSYGVPMDIRLRTGYHANSDLLDDERIINNLNRRLPLRSEQRPGLGHKTAAPKHSLSQHQTDVQTPYFTNAEAAVFPSNGTRETHSSFVHSSSVTPLPVHSISKDKSHIHYTSTKSTYINHNTSVSNNHHLYKNSSLVTDVEDFLQQSRLENNNHVDSYPSIVDPLSSSSSPFYSSHGNKKTPRPNHTILKTSIVRQEPTAPSSTQRSSSSSAVAPGSARSASTTAAYSLVTAHVLVDAHGEQIINEAAAPAGAAAKGYASAPYDGDGLSPTVVAVIVSLSVALLAVVLCILGFLVAELSCRRADGGPFRRNKVAPFTPT